MSIAVIDNGVIPDRLELIRTIDRIIDLLGWPNLNEFKHTSIPR